MRKSARPVYRYRHLPGQHRMTSWRCGDAATSRRRCSDVMCLLDFFLYSHSKRFAEKLCLLMGSCSDSSVQAYNTNNKIIIKKTCLYNFDPLKPHFYIIKLGLQYTIFLLLLKNIDCGYTLEPPRRGGSNEYRQSMF